MEADNPGSNPGSWLPWWLKGKESTCQGRRHGFSPRAGKIPDALGQLSHNNEPVL